jgi:hypothetical protein
MSRTYKDRPSRIRFPQVDNYEYFEYELAVPFINWKGKVQTHSIFHIKQAGILLKKPRHKDTEWHWQSTPSWWTRMYMLRPERTRANRETAKIKRMPLDQLEEVDVVDLKKKPHIYYW